MTIIHDYKSGIQIINKTLEIYEKELPMSHRDIIVKWGKIIKEFGKNVSKISSSKIIPITIGTPVGIFSYLFDFDKIKSYVENEDHKPIVLKAKPLEKLCQIDVPDIANELPLTILETPLLLQSAILTGHDKVLTTLAKGNKNVSAYILVETEFTPLMYNNYSKSIYYFLRDVQKLASSPVVFPNKELFYFKQDKIFQ